MRNLPHTVEVFRVVRVTSPSGGSTNVRTSQGTYPAVVALAKADDSGTVTATEVASVRFPHGVVVLVNDELQVRTPPGRMADTKGWKVTSVRWNRDHQRCMATRIP